MPGIVTFFVVNLYVGNYLKNLFALPRPTASPGGPKEEDFGWPSMYAVNAVGLPFFALRYLWGAVGTGTPLSAHYQLVTSPQPQPESQPQPEPSRRTTSW